jgi:uncharacterized membrane protein
LNNTDYNFLKQYKKHANQVSKQSRNKSQKEYLLKRVELDTNYIKHIQTISTASIVLLVTLLEKLFQNPEWKFLVGVSLVGFMITIVAGVVSFTTELAKTSYKGISSKGELLDAIATAVMWLCFIISMISLVVFGLKNLY